jgi:alpha-mannosidase
VIESTADQVFNAIRPDMMSRMPRYTGDLELINHSAGSLTSQAYHKRQVIKNENLADAAEKASIAAEWMGGLPYARQRLNDAWTLELAGHFHDSAAGTATPLSYEYIWNDDTIASNQFATVLTSASAAVASGLDSRSQGMPIVVYNPLSIPREDLVEADVTFADRAPKAVHVYGPDGGEVHAQMNGSKVLFAAKAPSVGYAVYDVVPVETTTTDSELKVSQDSLENARYRVRLDRNGDVSSIYDKSLNKELLSAPMRLAISNDAPRVYPAWNMEFDQEQAPPRAYVGGKPEIRIKERGPVRVSIEVTRETEGSRFVQTISLARSDAGNRVEFANAIDWRTLSANLKATIPLSASNPEATYNWDIGTTQRSNANERQFEVGSHRWIDLTDKGGSFGAMILTDCKNGSDKPTDNTIRLTLLRSPGVQDENGRRSPYTDQANQDWGHHEFVFALAGHAGGWRDAATEWQAYRLNDPLIAFQTARHPGALGKSFSLLHLSDSNVRVLALKKAEDSDELILRLVELEGKPAPDVRVFFAAPVTAAREVTAQEQPVGTASLSDGALVTSLSPYQPRTFALKLSAPAVRLASVASRPVKLDYDHAVASDDDTKTSGEGMDGHGSALPAEMLPSQIDYNGIQFQLAPAGTGKANAVIAKGQTIALPQARFNRIMILAASGGEDRKELFRVGTRNIELNIQSWAGFIGQWDTRVWNNLIEHDWAVSAHHALWPPPDMAQRASHPVERTPSYPEDYVGLKAGYIKPASVAWYASHHHTADGLNEPYQYSYLFAYQMDVAPGTRTLTLPNDGDIRILAISVAADHPPLKSASPLYDMLGQTEPTESFEASHR